MRQLEPYADEELTWQSVPCQKRTWNLSAGQEVVATLTQPSTWSPTRIGTTADGQWRFTQKGVVHRRLVVTDTHSGAEVAHGVRSSRSGNGTLTLADGRKYVWRAANAFGSKWAWLDEAGQPLLQFRESGVLRVRSTVTLTARAVDDPHVGFLALVGWHLMLLTNQEATTAAMTAVGA